MAMDCSSTCPRRASPHGQFRYKKSRSQTLTIGKLADMSLAEARKRADKARVDAADGKP